MLIEHTQKATTMIFYYLNDNLPAYLEFPSTLTCQVSYGDIKESYMTKLCDMGDLHISVMCRCG